MIEPLARLGAISRCRIFRARAQTAQRELFAECRSTGSDRKLMRPINSCEAELPID